MRSASYVMTVTGALCLMILITRGLPFIFTRFLKQHKALRVIGNYLPAYIMLLLVIYEVGINNFMHYPYAIPSLIALSALTIVHIWKRQMLLSIFIGTLVYILLNRANF